MPRGDKSAYTEKQKRQAEHIEDSERERGASEGTAERIAWATVNKQDGGGKRSGSARKGTKKAASKKAASKAPARKSAAKKATTKATARRRRLRRRRRQRRHRLVRPPPRRPQRRQRSRRPVQPPRAVLQRRRRPRPVRRRRPCARWRPGKRHVPAPAAERIVQRGNVLIHAATSAAAASARACSSRCGPSNDTWRASGNRACSSATLGGHSRRSWHACRHSVGTWIAGSNARTSTRRVAAARCRNVLVGVLANASRSIDVCPRVYHGPSNRRASNATGGSGQAGDSRAALAAGSGTYDAQRSLQAPVRAARWDGAWPVQQPTGPRKTRRAG